MFLNWYNGTGKKKRCISRILLREGNGRIFINKINAFYFFKRKNLINYIIKPLNITSANYDIFIKTKGGGEVSKAISIMFAISAAIIEYNKKNILLIKKNKLLTIDSRKVERKKIGYVKSRKKKQYTKR
ncbi:30S ribosomal protein S9 [Candidatus Vidania fulgoroideorum]